MATSPLKDLGLAVGSFLGDRSKLYAAGLSAGIYQKSLALRGDILKKVTEAGQTFGKYGGQAIPEALAAGALATGPAGSASMGSRVAGFDIRKIGLWALGGAVVLWILLRSR